MRHAPRHGACCGHWVSDVMPIARLDGEDFPGFDRVRRGLSFGDGLFETMRVSGSRIELWTHHLARLKQGCARLGMDAPGDTLLAGERDHLAVDAPEAVLKLMVWRDTLSRGYDTGSARSTHRCWTVEPMVPPDQAPLRARWCDLRVALQPRLAGIKSLNRLEQVLARAEWAGTEWDEGLLLDSAGKVVGATAGNLFAVIDGSLVTPALDQCGVAGVFRAWMLASDGEIGIRDILRADIERASEVFVTNAVRGIRPIGAIDRQSVAVGAVTHAWIARARLAGLMATAGSVR